MEKGNPYLLRFGCVECITHFTNIGEILRDIEHDRLILPYLTGNNLVSDLSDYEYFRAICLAHSENPLHITVQTDRELLSDLFGFSETLTPESADRVWKDTAEALFAFSDNETIEDDVCCYHVGFDRYNETSIKNGQVVEYKTLNNGIPTFVMLTELMPAVFRRPDRYHAELAFRHRSEGKCYPDELDLLYSQLLRDTAEFCCRHRIPLALSHISSDVRSYIHYLRLSNLLPQMIIQADWNASGCITGENVMIAVSDVLTLKRILPFTPLKQILFLPTGSNRMTMKACQMLFHTNAEAYLFSEVEHKSAQSMLRALEYDNLRSVFGQP